MNSPSTLLFVLDVDGVLTNKEARPNLEVIELAGQIGGQHAVTGMTGRATAWLEKHIFPTLTDTFRRWQPVHAVFGAECGSFLLQWTGTSWNAERTPEITPLDDLRDHVRTYVRDIPGVIFDEDKHVMISVEADHRLWATQRETIRVGLAHATDFLREIATGKHKEVEVLTTTYAVDLVPKGLSKSFGAKRLLESLSHRPTHVHLIGDSLSDLLLADPLKERGIDYTMHFVGDPKQLTSEHTSAYHIDVTNNRYDQGTVEVLTKFL
jgi:hydroxymethylpyrimidine pyrophosphatase-like HAD family hydrolase